MIFENEYEFNHNELDNKIVITGAKENNDKLLASLK